LISFDKRFSSLFSEKLRTDNEGHGPTHKEFIGYRSRFLGPPLTHPYFYFIFKYRAFQAYGNFSSGVSVHYAPSTITDPTHQTAATNLIIGQCLLPHVLVRAADAREVNIQDLAPSDGRFRLFVFPGDVAPQEIDGYLNRPECFFSKMSRDALDVVTVLQGDKRTINYLQLPQLLRPHWTK
jgi:phenol 2-monooxygenase (NADPH)